MSETKGKFATETAVTPEKTLTEIRALIKRYGGAKAFGVIEEETYIGVAFTMRDRSIRFMVPLPTRDDAKQAGTNQYGYAGTYNANKHEQLIRSRWRSLLLVIKAKLESVDLGVETFEEAFMAQLVLPTGQTAGEWFIPEYHKSMESGAMPPLLPSGANGGR